MEPGIQHRPATPRPKRRNGGMAVAVLAGLAALAVSVPGTGAASGRAAPVPGPGVASAAAAGGSGPTRAVDIRLAGAQGATYQNPVFTDDGREVPDPAVIRGRDGYWYAYATGDGFRIARSADLVRWERVGSVFTDQTRPSWAPTGGLWAPDISYFDGRYHLTFTVANSPLVGPTPNRSVGVATAPTPTGPWTDSGAPLLEPEWWYPTPNAPRDFRSIMDTELLTTPDGRRILYYGGFRGGIHAVELSPDGLSVAGEPVKLTSEFSYEGPYVVHRDGWYYLFGSSGACCAGPVSGYTVLVGRSRDPFGPFLDRAGVPMLSRTPGGTHVLAPNGNIWVGTGHHSVATDATGQEWMVYHAIDRFDPSNTANPYTGNKRPMLIDRLDWIDGWPVVRGGAGASAEPQPVPASAALVDDQFERGSAPGATWTSPDGWQIEREPAGGYLHAGTADGERLLTAERAVAGDVRARAAVRLPDDADAGAGAVGMVFANHDDGGGVRAAVDRAAGALTVRIDRAGSEPVRVTRSLPDGFRYESWHEIAVEIRGRSLTASVSDAGLYDPVATVTATLPAGLAGGEFGLLARDTAADVDDVTVAPLYLPHTERVPGPQVGQVVLADEFDSALDPAWHWLRTPAGTVREGQLDFPVQSGDLNGDGNDASVLLRDAPAGDVWTVETRLTLRFGDAQPDRYPQAGLVAYVDDDNFLRFSHRAHGAVQTTAFSKEMVFDGRRGAGGVDIVAPPADVTYLRLHHRLDPATGDHVYQSGVSRDGETWVWGTAYTLPAGTTPRVGLVAHGGDGGHLAQFDYVRFLQP